MTTQDRLNAFGDQLIHVHSWLRAEPARLRENVDLHLEGRAARPRDLRAELDGLAALMESHFTYEERKIVAALDTIGWDGTTPDFLRTGST
ncbi:hypothetical protein [Nonomuraea insulae]|uniref:Hemerythrin-like domain-containing protein n=1 Tax=Nonomuraea insulae TaxID=1616787 RepID=A0ABW1DDE8_9ACTN